MVLPDHRPSVAQPKAYQFKSSGLLSFVGCWLLIAMIWIWLLPIVAKQPSMRRIIQRHRDAGINPSAMVYTELGPITGVEFEYCAGKGVLREFELNSR